jgi:hypothetical protein
MYHCSTQGGVTETSVKAYWAYITLLRYFPKGLKLLYTTTT